MGGECTTIAIRPESAEDHDAIRQLVAAAFGPEGEAELVDRIRTSPEYVAEMALVAEVDGEVVGHVMVSNAVHRVRHRDRSSRMGPARSGTGQTAALV